MNKYQEALEVAKIEYFTPTDEGTKEKQEAYKTLQELVDRATPKKVVYEKLFGEDTATCPNCHNGILEQDAFNTQIFYSGKYCSHCGQALDWEKEGK